MLNYKRVIIATILGIVFGIVCMLMASSDPNKVVEPQFLWSIVAGRALLGFMIGISALNCRWWLHGIILGLIGSIPMAIPVINDIQIFIGTFVMGMIYGFLIELITSILFKAKPVALLK
jgi:hypothetical protein